MVPTAPDNDDLLTFYTTNICTSKKCLPYWLQLRANEPPHFIDPYLVQMFLLTANRPAFQALFQYAVIWVIRMGNIRLTNTENQPIKLDKA